jgi:hypothetical protein
VLPPVPIFTIGIKNSILTEHHTRCAPRPASDSSCPPARPLTVLLAQKFFGPFASCVMSSIVEEVDALFGAGTVRMIVIAAVVTVVLIYFVRVYRARTRQSLAFPSS